MITNAYYQTNNQLVILSEENRERFSSLRMTYSGVVCIVFLCWVFRCSEKTKQYRAKRFYAPKNRHPANSLLQTCKKYDIIEKNTAFNQTEVYYAQKANHRPDVRF